MTRIYRKAKRLIDEGGVVLDERTFDTAYYNVGDHTVHVNQDRTVTCTCKAYTLDAQNGKLCSHAVACLTVHTLRAKLGDPE